MIVCMWHFPVQHNVALHCVQHSVLWVQTLYPFQLDKNILTAWGGLCGYDRDISCQDFCTVYMLGTFPTPSSSPQSFIIYGWYIFKKVMKIIKLCVLYGKIRCLILAARSARVHELLCIKNNIWSSMAVVQWPKVAGKAQHYFSF